MKATSNVEQAALQKAGATGYAEWPPQEAKIVVDDRRTSYIQPTCGMHEDGDPPAAEATTAKTAAVKGATKGDPAEENKTAADEATTGPEEEAAKSEVAVLKAAHEKATDVKTEEPSTNEIVN